MNGRIDAHAIRCWFAGCVPFSRLCLHVRSRLLRGAACRGPAAAGAGRSDSVARSHRRGTGEAPDSRAGGWLARGRGRGRGAENAITQAEDAFGFSSGKETLGLHTTSNVRGFSPSAAGNLRIDGLYFDQVFGLTNRVRQSSSIRVGLSAHGIPFPAPTGIVDYRLYKPGGTPSLSALVNVDSYGSASLESESDIVATRDNLVAIPARTLLDLGGRYRFELAGRAATLRVRLTNLTGEEGFELKGSGAYDFIQGRLLTANLAVDF